LAQAYAIIVLLVDLNPIIMRSLFLLPALTSATLPTTEIVPGVFMPKVSIGTWTSGSVSKQEDAHDIVLNWLGQGFQGIDTAMDYFNQDRVALGIVDSGVPREDLFITTKIPGCADAAQSVNYDLGKLNTSYIDLLLIHAPIGLPGACPKTWKVLEDFVSQGKLRSIGVSNFNQKQMQKIMDIATVPIAVNQIEYNVFSHNEETIAFCDANNITVEAWSPLNGAHGGKSVFKDETVLRMAAAHNVSAAQVAMRWIVQRGHHLTVLTSNPEHQANDADLFAFELAEDEMDTLTSYQNQAVTV